jgi:riboflavin synthase
VFTGIVEELGTVAAVDSKTLRVVSPGVVAKARIGDSIAVNGCCLTVVRRDETSWEADLSEETLRRTSLSGLKSGDRVNIEAAACMGDPIGGHLVQGHVDAVGVVTGLAPDLRVRLPESLMRYCVTKGSVAVDGVSLTIVDVMADEFTVALIPHTMSVTTLGFRRAGEQVNIEVDALAKNVERLLAFMLPQPTNSPNTEEHSPWQNPSWSPAPREPLDVE